MPQMVVQQREAPERATFPHQDVEQKQMVLVLQRNRGKCEGCWVRHSPTSCKGKAFKGFNKKGMPKEAPKPEKPEKKSKRKEETDDGKERKRNRLTAAFATTYNEANNSSDNEE